MQNKREYKYPNQTTSEPNMSLKQKQIQQKKPIVSSPPAIELLHDRHPRDSCITVIRNPQNPICAWTPEKTLILLNIQIPNLKTIQNIYLQTQQQRTKQEIARLIGNQKKQIDNQNGDSLEQLDVVLDVHCESEVNEIWESIGE